MTLIHRVSESAFNDEHGGLDHTHTHTHSQTHIHTHTYAHRDAHLGTYMPHLHGISFYSLYQNSLFLFLFYLHRS